MKDMLTINVTNDPGPTQPFFAFQQPPNGLADGGTFAAFNAPELASSEPGSGGALPIVATDHTRSTAYLFGLAVRANGVVPPSDPVIATMPDSFDGGAIPTFYVQMGKYEPGGIVDVAQPGVNAAPGTRNTVFAIPAITDLNGNAWTVQL